MTELQSKAAPQRFRVSVPAADEAVLAWMALQDNQSLSMRMLIRENIERNGYIDVVNRPVVQLPKRGRPLGSEEEQAVAATFAHQVPAAERPAPVEPVDLDLSAESSHASELLGIALEVPSLVNTASPEQGTAKDSSPIPSEPEQTSGEQIDVNDIFTSVR